MKEFFQKAKPIWTAEKSGEMNVTCLFSVALGKGDYKIRLTACNFYRLTVNGKFLGYGPARAAHGYARVDVYEFSLKGGGELTAEVAGYACNSFYSLNEQPFFQAEIERGGKIVAFTGENGAFSCVLCNERVQKVARFSYQRPFSESYDFTGKRKNAPAAIMRVPEYRLLNRRVSYPKYDCVSAVPDETGEFCYEGEKVPYDNRYLTLDALGIFPLAELETYPAKHLEGIRYRVAAREGNVVSAGQYAVYAFSRSETGFLQTEAIIGEDCRFLLLFDEVDYREDRRAGEARNICFERNETYNIIEYRAPKGRFFHTSFEPYTARYVKLLVLEGSLTVNGLSIVRYENPDVPAQFPPSGDEKIDAIVQAAAQTFRHNAVDILTDCPSRERAGWLCDSWFSARAELFFTGKNTVEYNFLENIALAPDQQPLVPKGMIPMCYPADFSQDKMYIPNWAMWYVMELYDYSLRSGDAALPALSRKKVYDLLSYFKQFENSDGLLEDLKGWIFVEWSKANDDDFVCGVNYPSNMVYAKALECAGALYCDNALKEKAEAIKRIVRTQSFNGEFFEDNAVRSNGELVRTGHVSETCQYYAFFCGVASEQTHGDLWQTLFHKFGPDRGKGVYEGVFPSNAFIGNYLRLSLLKERGFYDKVKAEAVGYFYKMAKKTGTLWEHDSVFGSLDHGFASYIAVLLAQ